MLSVLTLNIQAAGLPRARALLRWLDQRDDDVVILTETSSGEGTAYLLEQCRRAGLSVTHAPAPDGDRGVALVSRAATVARPDLVAGVSPPGRVAAVTIASSTSELTVFGVYVPSSDRAPNKVARKQGFITSLLAAVRGLPDQARARLVLGGDYNVITRDHQPPHRGFLPFEYQMLDTLHGLGLVDAYRHRRPEGQVHSWIGRSGNGYRFDYIHVGTDLRDDIVNCDYLHEPRDERLSDHAAVALTLRAAAPVRLPVDPAGLAGAGALF